MSDQQDDGKVTPTQAQNHDPMGGDRMLAGMVEYITGIISKKLVAPEQREHLCMEFIEMLGRMVEFMEGLGPMTPGKMAALLYFNEKLGGNRMTEDQAFVVLTLVDAAKNTVRKMRREARPA